MIFQLNYEAEYAGFGLPAARPVYMRRPRPPLSEALGKMRDFIRSSGNPDLLEHVNDNDNFLSRFLFTRKMNIDASVRLLENFVSFRKAHSEIFANMTLKDPHVQMCLRNHFPGVLPDRDRNGRCVLFLSLRHWSRPLFSIPALFRSLLLLMDSLLTDTKIQYSGFVFVLDWHSTALYVNPRQLKTFIAGLQDCYPARFKAIHFLNQPVQVDLLLTLVRPFLKEKTRDKIFVHGPNLDSLYDFIPKSILPDEIFGGSVPLSSCIHEAVIVAPGPVIKKTMAIV